MSKFYITTAIDYVNDTIHIGHAFQKIAADVLARYYRVKLGKENVFFLTGTDEFGQKAEKAAKEANLSNKEFVDNISRLDQEQQDSLNISYDRFIRTTDLDHIKVAQEIWNRVNINGDIYLDKYTGLYCEGCEAYYTEKDLINGKCPFHPKQDVKKITEENYFFKWSKYKDFLINHIKTNPHFIVPNHRAKEMIEFAKEIKDIPISRTNFTWGIPVPNDNKQVVYVWFDALINYISGIGFLENKNLFNKFWPADIHILGKDNLRWHALLWPAMLKSADIELPKTILVNGFINLNGEKISKSLGNIIRPTDWVKKYSTDAIRYYLLRYTILTEDSDISEEKLIQAYNSDLANGLGNLIARVAKLCETARFKQAANVNSHIILEQGDYDNAMKNYKFNDALAIIWNKISTLDKYINEEKPWELLKLPEGDKKLGNIETILAHATNQIQEIAILLSPFMPETSHKISSQFEKSEIKTEVFSFSKNCANLNYMGFFETLIILAVLIYFINVIPVLMPPTWSILAFYYINFHPPLLPAVIIAAFFATLGRITLYYISKNFLRNLFSKESLSNYDDLGNFFQKKEKLSIPLFLTYAFFPISSNYVYIAAGLAKIDIKILAASFFAGRLFSYFFWTTASHIVFTKIEDIFSSRISNLSFIAIEITGLIIIVLIGKIKWKKFLKI